MIAESNAIADQLSAMPYPGNWLEEGYSGPNADLAARYREVDRENATNWLRDDYIGPNAELAARWRALDAELTELFPQLQELEERRRECAEAVG